MKEVIMDKQIKNYKWRQVSYALIFTLLMSIGQIGFAESSTCEGIFSIDSNLEIKFDFQKNINEQIATDAKSNVELLTEKLQQNYINRNKILSERYPGLSFVLKDPEAFIETMRDRFEKTKVNYS